MGGSEADGAADRSPGPSEVYCIECGSIIKEKAELCPECGVRQPVEDGQQAPGGGAAGAAGGAAAGAAAGGQPTQQRVRELRNIAETDGTTAMLVGFLVSPIAYLLVGKWGWAALNFLTGNYLLLGPIIVPFHVKSIIQDAREELAQLEQR